MLSRFCRASTKDIQKGIRKGSADICRLLYCHQNKFLLTFYYTCHQTSRGKKKEKFNFQGVFQAKFKFLIIIIFILRHAIKSHEAVDYIVWKLW